MNVKELVYTFDPSNDMEMLTFDGVVIGYGNWHDDHCEDRAKAVRQVLDLLGVAYNFKKERANVEQS